MVRTLDDVIKIYERGISEVEAYDAVEDALHYLTDYRDKNRQLDVEKARYQEAVRNCEEAENKYRMAQEALDAQRLHMMWVDKHFKFEEPNDPLTWDELKGMEGMPVWITLKSFGRETPGKWFLILVVKQDEIMITDQYGNQLIYPKKHMIDMWTAYSTGRRGQNDRK